MKSYKERYCRDSSGNIRVWWMDQDDNKYRMCSGVSGGAIVESNWTSVQGKNIGRANETSPEEQATKEIEARYKKQEETGYWENIKDVDKFQYFSPMLAHKWKEHKDKVDWSKGAYISPKMDGVRCILQKNGATSRNGKCFPAFPHILRELKPLFDENPSLILDGECYTHKLRKDFDKIISLAKTLKPTNEDLVESEKYLQFWIFDCPTIEGGFHNRYNTLKELLKPYKDNKWIKLCEHKLIKSPDDIEPNLQGWLVRGFEGIMINTYDGLYENKRSYNLLKYKQFIDEEFEIVDIEEGVGNRAGIFGKAYLKNSDGKVFKANARGNEEFYARMLKEKKDLIGKLATVRYQNLTPDEKVPRFGVIICIRDYE
jgi:DNA ligase 1